MSKQKSKVDFRLSVFLACIVFDTVDYLVDLIQATGGDLPIIGAVVDFFGGSVDVVSVFVGLLIFTKMKAGVVVSTMAIVDPIVTDALPLYTISYLYAVWFDVDAEKIKKTLGA